MARITKDNKMLRGMQRKYKLYCDKIINSSLLELRYAFGRRIPALLHIKQRQRVKYVP